MVFGSHAPEHRGAQQGSSKVKDGAKHMKALIAVLGLALTTGMGAAQGLDCNMQAYKAVDGVAAVFDHKSVTLTWTGESDQQLRAQFTLRDGQPMVEELAARKPGGAWVILGKDLTPQFEVTTGRRRMSKTEKDILVRLNQDTPENEEIYKWNVFWDAPLAVPGTDASHLVGPPRTEAEIARAKVSYKSDACSVKTDGDARHRHLQRPHPRPLLRRPRSSPHTRARTCCARRRSPAPRPRMSPSSTRPASKGFAIGDQTKLVWRDTSQLWQENDFGGEVNQRSRQHPRAQPAGDSRYRRRLARQSCRLRTSSSSRARTRSTSATSTTARTTTSSFSLGAMQPERCEGYDPWGVSDEVWQHRSSTARSQTLNCALYNAPPGTMQRMAVYYYLSPTGSHATQQAVMAYTHDDVYKPVPGFKTVTGHFHLELNEMARDRGTTDLSPTWVPVFRGLGINIVYLGDFHDDSDGSRSRPQTPARAEGLLRGLAPSSPTRTSS